MNKRVVEYKLAYGGGGVGIEESVNELIKRGFQPFGQLVVAMISVEEEAIYYAQPMVRYED